MKIEFYKIDAFTHRLTVTRLDKTTASVVLETKTYFLHDICHYFVEQELVYEKGFWGILDAGYDFTELSGRQNPLTEELKFIEKIVGPIQSIVQGHLPLERYESSTDYLNSELTRSISPESVIRKIKEFMQQWNALTYGQGLQLNFKSFK